MLRRVALEMVVVAGETRDDVFEGGRMRGVHRSLNGGFDRFIVST